MSDVVSPRADSNVLATLHDRIFIQAPPWPVTLGLLALVGTLLGMLHQRYRLPRLRAAIDRAYVENRRVAERAGLTPPDDGTSPAR